MKKFSRALVILWTINAFLIRLIQGKSLSDSILGLMVTFLLSGTKVDLVASYLTGIGDVAAEIANTIYHLAHS